MSNLQQFDEIKAKVLLQTAPAMAIIVESKEHSMTALESARSLKAIAKSVEERRKDLVGPLQAKVKEINEYAKSILLPIEAAEKHLKTELVKWEQYQEKERQAALKKADDERKAKEKELLEKQQAEAKSKEFEDMFMPKTADDERAEISNKIANEREQYELEKNHKSQINEINSSKIAGVTKRWTFEVTDASKVPAEFLVVDDKKIREAVRHGVRSIDGVRIFQETGMAIR